MIKLSDYICDGDEVTATQSTTNPSASDDSFNIGTIWINTTSDVYYICVDNTASNAVWVKSGGGINTFYLNPSEFNYDDTDLGVDGGVAFGMVDTADFDNAEDGSIWVSFSFPDNWSTTSDIKFDAEYTLNGTDNTKNVRLVVKGWAIDTGETPSVSSPDLNQVVNITSSSSNTGKNYLFEMPSTVIPNASITSNTTKIIIKFTREASNALDTYGGTLQLMSIRAYQ